MIDKKEKIIAIVITLLMHFIIISILFQSIFRDRPKRYQGSVEIVRLVPKQSTKTDNHLKKLYNGQGIVDNTACKNGERYLGIGIIYSGKDDIIVVAPGYPAYDAGVQVNDHIIDLYDTEDGYTSMLVLRHGQAISFYMRETYVCSKNGHLGV